MFNRVKAYLRASLLVLWCLLCIGVLSLSPATAAPLKVLNVYTWAGYLSDEVIREFERETGIRINHSTYINNEVLYAKLKANAGGSGYDVIMPSAYFVNRMVQQDLLQEIDPAKITHFKHINPRFLNQAHDPKNRYSVPYLWTATGIVFNQKYHPLPAKLSWAELWKPEYRDCLLILDDVREVSSIALMRLGYSINERTVERIREAFELLKGLMPNVKLFNTDSQRSVYLDEDVTIGMGWNGDLTLAQRENPALRFVYPEEGFMLALDCVAIPKKAANVEGAHLFINFLSRPEIAKKIAMETGFSTANLGAIRLLPEDMRHNEVLYPGDTVMKRAKFPLDVGSMAAVYEKFFESLKLRE